VNSANEIVRAEVPNIPETASILAVIDRAARDPACDIDKMERLLAMHERIVEREAKAAYSTALARMQPELPMIAERGSILNKSGGVQSVYALWEDVVTVITPILSRHGFALSFRTGNFEGGVSVTGVLSHELGHSEQTEIKLPIDGSGSKNAVQAVGSSTSYGKRYTAAALLNLRTGQEDDDGQAGGGKPLKADMGPRPDIDMETYGQVFPFLTRAADIKAGEFTDEQIDAAIFAMHEELRSNAELYTAVADALAAKGIISKGAWKTAIANHKRREAA
jgi:hypothetical protein